MSFSRIIRVWSFAVAVLVCFPVATHGASYLWDGSSGAQFTNANNWTPAGVPGAADTTTFRLGAVPAYPVWLFMGLFDPINVMVDRVIVGTNTVSFAGGVLTVDNTSTSVGTLAITGNYTQSADGELLVELASTTSDDRLEITGVATLDGTLTVSLLGDFVPVLGDSFGFLFAAGGFGGELAALNLPSLAPGLKWQLNPGWKCFLADGLGRAPDESPDTRRSTPSAAGSSKGPAKTTWDDA